MVILTEPVFKLASKLDVDEHGYKWGQCTWTALHRPWQDPSTSVPASLHGPCTLCPEPIHGRPSQDAAAAGSADVFWVPGMEPGPACPPPAPPTQTHEDRPRSRLLAAVGEKSAQKMQGKWTEKR